MNDRRRARHWTDYVFGEIGSQELDDFGEAIRSAWIAPAEVRLLAEAMADRARSHFGADDHNGGWAALGMLDGADAEIAGLPHRRTARVHRVAVRSANAPEETTSSTALGA